MTPPKAGWWGSGNGLWAIACSLEYVYRMPLLHRSVALRTLAKLLEVFSDNLSLLATGFFLQVLFLQDNNVLSMFF